MFLPWLNQIAGGTTVGPNCTIGALTYLPTMEYPQQTTWVGAPAIQIPDYKDVLEQQELGQGSMGKRVFVDIIGLPYLYKYYLKF